MTLKLTNHAKLRWAERCPGIDPEREWYAARKCGKYTKRKIKLACPGHANLMRGFQGYWYALGPSNIVFVVDGDQNIITVFPYNQA